MRSDEDQGRQTAPKSDDHPGLDTDEATDKGKMMTGVGSSTPRRMSLSRGPPARRRWPTIQASRQTRPCRKERR